MMRIATASIIHSPTHGIDLLVLDSGRTTWRPASGVCGSRVPKINRRSPLISGARASADASGSAANLPSGRQWGSSTPMPTGAVTSRTSWAPPVRSSSQSRAASASEWATGVVPHRAELWPCPHRRIRGWFPLVRSGGRSRALQPESRSLPGEHTQRRVEWCRC